MTDGMFLIIITVLSILSGLIMGRKEVMKFLKSSKENKSKVIFDGLGMIIVFTTMIMLMGKACSG